MMNVPGSLELWGGAECTLNRVGARYSSQLDCSGHGNRLEDLDRIAELGIRTIRFPLLWEQFAPRVGEPIDWTWADLRLERIRALGMRPIIGLLHHGSGPAYTDLLDPCFAEKLASYARCVAEHYPWIEAYTPVNEPLTTARFSGLYGHWFPHRRDALSFARMLLGQVRGVALAMRAIREINPAAQLVQTEDLGRTFAPAHLAEQAHFENERRWLVFDLLSGKFDPQGVVGHYLRHVGIQPEELAFALEEAPVMPAVLGVNHYVTSSRYLDPEVENYPPELRGGNGRDAYVDVEAVRARASAFCEPLDLLREAWERYGLPLAITEAHLSCTREEQIRWLRELWSAATRLRAEGVPVLGVTAWSLFGAFDWDSLLTEPLRHYEPGAYDLRAPEPRATALVGALRELATTGAIASPQAQLPGWWRRNLRVLPSREERRAAARKAAPNAYIPPLLDPPNGRPAPLILIAGATGNLGQTFARLCLLRGLPYRLLSRQEMDIADPAMVESAIRAFQPWALINAAGFAKIDEAESARARCFRENCEGAAVLARAAAQHGLALLALSTDQVFNGAKNGAYDEGDVIAPLHHFGASKAAAEKVTLEFAPGALIVRTGALFNPWNGQDFLARCCAALRRGEVVRAAEDVVVSPSSAPDVVHAALDLLIDCEAGIWHLANGGAVSWAELARCAARLAGLDEERVVGCPQRALPQATLRPANSALVSARGNLLSGLEEALQRYLYETGWTGAGHLAGTRSPIGHVEELETR